MSENPTDNLLAELKNLNKDLTNELKRGETLNSDVSASDSSTFTTQTTSLSVTPNANALNNDNLNEFILNNARQIIQNGVQTIKDLQGIVGGTFDAKLLMGYAAVVQATTSSIDSLNKLNIQREQVKANKEIKILDIDARKQITSEKKPNNTLNIIATREEIIKMMQGVEETPAIDVQSKDVPLSESET